MARLSREEQARRDGMAYACRRIKQDGMEAFEEELRRRGASGGMPISIDEKSAEEWTVAMRRQTLSTVLVMALVVLQDGFGFGETRARRFADRFNDYADSVMRGGLVDLEDFQRQIREELRIEVDLYTNDKKILANRRV